MMGGRRQYTTWLIALLLFGAVFALLPFGGVQAQPPDPSFTMDPQFVNVGDTFDVPILFGTDVNVRSARFNIQFDPAIVRVESVTEGGFFSDYTAAHGGTTQVNPGVIDNNAGTVSGFSVSLSGVSGGPIGGGVVAVIRFTAVANGKSVTNISDIFVTDSNDYFVYNNIVAGGLVQVGPGEHLVVASMTLRPAGEGIEYGYYFDVHFRVGNYGVSPSQATLVTISANGAEPLIQQFSVPSLQPGDTLDYILEDYHVQASAAVVTVAVQGDGSLSTIYRFTPITAVGDTHVNAYFGAYLEVDPPDEVVFREMQLGPNEEAGILNVKCNTGYRVDLYDANFATAWRLRQWNDMAGYGSYQLTEALLVRHPAQGHEVSSGSPDVLIASGNVSGQNGDLGQNFNLAFDQFLRYSDAVLPGADVYRLVLTFHGYIAF